eukprot:13301096-Alexandrium_andersonii.AAC.1
MLANSPVSDPTRVARVVMPQAAAYWRFVFANSSASPAAPAALGSSMCCGGARSFSKSFKPVDGSTMDGR